MSARAERLANDQRDLLRMAGRSQGRLTVINPGPGGRIIDRVVLDLRLRTAVDTSYPARAADRVRLTLTLPDEFPASGPRASFAPVVFHPNVYSSGDVCTGLMWRATIPLTAFIENLIKIVVFDPAAANPDSPASWTAANWYRAASRRNPWLFPTEAIDYLDLQKRPEVRWHA